MVFTSSLSGDAWRLTGDFDSDRKLLVEIISGVLVYPNGSLVVEFQEASLFEPMRFAQLPNTVNGQDRDLARARAAARREVQEQRAEIERVAGKKALENLEMDVEIDADGHPAFIMMTAGVVKRTFGGAQASSRRSDEVALCVPSGTITRFSEGCRGQAGALSLRRGRSQSPAAPASAVGPGAVDGGAGKVRDGNDERRAGCR
jgi:hypothetical protein